MKRKATKYEVSSTFPMIWWRRCHFCNNEFTWESMWQSLMGSRYICSCKECSPDKTAFCENFDKWVVNSRPKVPPKAPPFPTHLWIPEDNPESVTVTIRDTV